MYEIHYTLESGETFVSSISGNIPQDKLLRSSIAQAHRYDNDSVISADDICTLELRLV